jgi:hypothetical protein
MRPKISIDAGRGARLATPFSLCLAALCALGARPIPAPAPRVLHVSASASGSGDGATWQTAFADLTSALRYAVAGDQVWVAEGVYTPSASDRAASFHLVSGVAVYGGFAGDELALDQRDWIQHRTVLSGDLAGNDSPDFANTEENSYHVVTALDVDASAILDGFTITGGHADGAGDGPVPESQDQGSALNIFFAAPSIAHVEFVHNWAFGHGTANDNGGASFTQCEFRENFAADLAAGVFIQQGASTRIVDCQFSKNTTNGKGAGVYCQSRGDVAIAGCSFYGNAATSGGGIYNASGSVALVRQCAFRANTAYSGGGGVYDDGSSPRVIDCTFENNAAGIDVQTGGGGVGGSGGGGLWNSGGHALVQGCRFRNNAASFGGGIYNNSSSQASVRDCEFDHNRAHEAGGIYNLSSPITVEHCAFQHNDAIDGDFSVGGGISNYYCNTLVDHCSFRSNHAVVGGGGVYNEGEAPTLVDCVFAHNYADGSDEGWGGGVLNGYFTSPVLCNCTFAGNRAHRGAAIFDLIYSAATIVNSTLSGNTSRDGGALYDFEGTDTRLENSIVWGNVPAELSGIAVRAEYCCIQGGYPGPGNIAADPLFERAPSPGPDGAWGTDDDACGDLRLRAGSPCIDAGDNFAVPAGITTDLWGNPRFVDDPDTADTGQGTAPIVDLGAFEF